MAPAIITMAYRQIIDISSTTPFEKEVFNISYAEFLVQQQSFSKGQDLSSWSALREKFPKSYPALPFKVSFALAGLLQSLDKKIPGPEDSSGTRSLCFISHQFELIASDTKDRSAHKVALTYRTGEYTLLYTVGNFLLLAAGDVREEMKGKPVPTFLLRIEPGLSISTYYEGSLSGEGTVTIFPAAVSAPQVSMSLSP